MAQLAVPGQVTGRLRPGLLLAEATSFVGRTAELRQITTLLRSARLVTLVGPGGVGKTRICQRAAMLAAGQFPDGVWLAELSGLRDPALLYRAIAAACKLPDQDAPSQRAAVLNWLRDRRLLLILDTCEHLIDACAMLAEDVLRAAAGVTVLATSRQPLDVPGEHAFPVLPLPAGADAVELFAQRATAVVPGFEVTPGNRADIVRLCQRLDGVPLAIELAAVRLRALPLPELADRLESGFGVLAVSRRGTTPRHQTLRAAVEWSHGLCTAAERTLWARLSVFAGPFDAGAAEDVCADGALPREEVIRALVGLVDKSVVLRSGTAENRYRLTNALREFGAEQLAASGDQARVLDRLTARYLDMARYFDEHLLDDDQADAYRALRQEYPNIRAALEYALGDHRPPAPAGKLLARARRGAELAVRLHAFWQISGLLSEGRNWLGSVQRLLPAPGQAPPRAAAPERTWALGVSGRLATLQGDTASALAEIGESIRQAEDLGEELAAAHGYVYLNLALANAGRHAAAMEAAAAARARLTACGHRAGLVCLQPQLAHLHQLAGNVEEAVRCCEHGLAMLGEGSRERWITGYLTLVCGLALYQSPGRDDDCASAIRRALLAKHDLGDEAGIAYCLEVLGWLAARASRFERAAWLLGAADHLWQGTVSRLGNVAILEETHGHAAEAARAALGDRRYESARAQAAGLPLDAVVRRAVAGTGAGGDALTAGWPAGGGADAAADAGPHVRADGLAPSAVMLPAVLTRREQEIARLVGSGLSNREIASRLFISKRTVDAHVEHIFGKLEISSRVQLTILLRDQLFA